MTDPMNSPKTAHEKEFKGPAWKHPYVIYVVLTVLLFLFLVVMAKIARENDWIPNRGNMQGP